MSALISLWVATTQFLKATFTPKSPVFFTFNGSRIEILDEYIVTDETMHSTRFTKSPGDKVSLSEASVGRKHLSSLTR
jgi:hypothetical protein